MEEVFSVVGHKGRGFFCCGIQRRRFSSVVGHKGRDFFCCGIQRRTISGRLKKFFVVSHNAGIFLPLYPTLQQKLMQCTVSHFTEDFSALYPTPENNFFFVINTTQKNCGMQCRIIFRIVSHNATGFLPLHLTMEEISLCCGIQQKRFFPVVGYNGRGFPPLWDTTEEFFFSGIQWKRFFPLGSNEE
jgi:hypothetical protein